jgi:hypothetical protein
MAEFSWAAAGDVGLGLVGGLSKGLEAAGAAEIAKANADAANTVRKARNEVARSQRNLAGTIRSLNNQRLMEAAGERVNSLTTNAVRTSDAFTRGNFEASIRGAEAWGQASARVAASGLGGAGIEAISRTTQSQIDRAKQARESGQADVTFDQSQATRNVVSNALVGLAAGPLTAQQDYSFNQAPGSFTGVAGALVQGLLSKQSSLSTLLGSLAPSGGQAPQGAQSFPVTQSNPEATTIPAVFNIGPYEDQQRLLNRSASATTTLN